MLKRIIPVLLLSQRALVKTRQFKDPQYVGDALNAVRIFSEKEADELVFLDIDASKQGREPDFHLIQDVSSEAYMPFSYGGGIKTLQQAERILKNGAEKIIINTAVLSNKTLPAQLIETFGSSSVVFCVDVKKTLLGHYKVYSHVEGQALQLSLKAHLQRCEDSGCGEIILQSVDSDGSMKGYDHSLISHARQHLSAPLVALGGAANLQDIHAVFKAGADAAAAGSLFTFYGKYRAVLLTYPSYRELQEILT